MMNQNKIPKIIHYCWFGKGDKPELVKKCIDSWKLNLSEYKIILWDEENFDVNCNTYVKEAYKEKKWAFVTDYVRLYALYNYGGIYLDSDVEVLKNLDRFLEHGAFSGFEDEECIPTGILGAKKGNKWIDKLLKYYDNRSFYNKDGSLDVTTNVETITKISQKYGFKIQEFKHQKFFDDVHIYPKDYFAPKSKYTGKINLTHNTYCIHHFAGSWVKKDIKYRIINLMIKVLGERNFKRIVYIKRALIKNK